MLILSLNEFVAASKDDLRMSVRMGKLEIGVREGEHQEKNGFENTWT